MVLLDSPHMDSCRLLHRPSLLHHPSPHGSSSCPLGWLLPILMAFRYHLLATQIHFFSLDLFFLSSRIRKPTSPSTSFLCRLICTFNLTCPKWRPMSLLNLLSEWPHPSEGSKVGFNPAPPCPLHIILHWPIGVTSKVSPQSAHFPSSAPSPYRSHDPLSPGPGQSLPHLPPISSSLFYFSQCHSLAFSPPRPSTTLRSKPQLLTC